MSVDEPRKTAAHRRVIRFPVVERGWRVFVLYAVGVGMLFVGAVWLQGRFDGGARGDIAMLAVIAVFIIWHFLGGARLELLGDAVVVRRSGFLAKPRHIPYSRIVRVEAIDDGVGLRLVIVEQDDAVTELGPWEMLMGLLVRRRIEAVQKEIAAGVARSHQA